MSLQLQPDQLLTVLYRLESPRAEEFEARLCDLADEMADLIVGTIPNLERGHANFELDMVCAPLSGTGPLPDALQGLDDEGWE